MSWQAESEMLSLLNVVTRCPDCDHRGLHPVDNGRTTNAFCARCSTCWHLTSTGPRRVDPLSCPGCSMRTACLLSASPPESCYD